MKKTGLLTSKVIQFVYPCLTSGIWLRSLLLALILIVGVGQMWGDARSFNGTERVFVRNRQFTDWDPWVCSGTYGWVHLWGGSVGEKDVDLVLVSGTENTADAIYAFTPPEGTYTTMVLARSNSSSEHNYANGQSKNITIPEDVTKNYIHDWSPSGYGEDYINWNKYAPTPAISGTMNSWNAVANAFSGTPLRCTIDFPAGTAYNFKVVDGTTWYGFGGLNDLTYVGQTEEQTLSSSGNNIMLLTASAGTYTFEWDADDKKLKVFFPSTKHPSMDYVYMEKYDGWNSGNYCYMHYWYSDGGGDHPLTDWATTDPKITAYFSSKSPNHNYYTFPILADYPKFIAKDARNNPANYTTMDGLEISTSEAGHYTYWGGSSWVWGTFQVYIKLENQGADEGKKGTLGVPVAFNDTALSARISKPVKTNYDFGGYYTAAEGGGVQIIDANGDWIANKLDYTSATGAWIHAGDTTTLYAKWTETARTITLQVSPEGTGSFTVGEEAKLHGDQITAYISTATPTITATPSHAAWKFARWEYGTGVGNKEGTGSNNTVQITSDRNGTLTAVFEPRFSLVGDKYGSSDKGGMPGWEESAYDDSDAFFTVNSTSPSVNLTCTCTLDAGTRYEFQVHDRYQNKNLGAGTDGQYILEDKAFVDLVTQDVNVTFTTTGAGRYIFHIYGILENDRPRLEILWPRKVNFGWKYADADAPNTLSEGGGGTVTAYVHEGGVKTAVSYDDYIINGATVSFTAHPYNDYQLAGWWNDYGFSNKTNMNGDSVHWTVTTENAQLYAKFVEKTDTLKSGTTWSTNANWSTGSQPTADIVAVIKSPVEVDITTAKAKKVLIMQNSTNTGQLEIPAGKELVVRTTIRKTTDGSTYGATGENDIIIGSSRGAGNGALVMGAHDGTNKATVYFATKAKTTGEGEDKHNVNQFIGTPFNDENDILYDYYGTKIYEFRAGQDGTIGGNWWRRLASTGDKMLGFKGYNILTNQTESPVLEMTGQLSRTNTTETIDGYYNGSSYTENMFANSWVAPIYIPNFKDTCFVNIEKTIYIFNAGTPKDQEGHAMGEGNAETEAAGQYSVLPANSSVYTGLKVIPSMQAFSVFAKGENPKLKFDYRELVYNPSNGTAGITPNRAPKRTNEDDAPIVLKMRATGESGYAVNVVMLERGDLTEGFDDGWDGRFMAGDDAAPQLYAVTPDGNMAINSIPNIEGTLLGFKAGEADDVFTFSFDYDGEALYLYDTHLQIYTRVMTGNTYTFATSDNESHNRFILTHNAPGVATGIEPVNNPSQVNNKMIIDNHLYIFRGGVLYDALGRMIGNGKEAGL